MSIKLQNNKFLLILLILILPAKNVSSQITFGSLKEAEDFSALQLEGTTGGIRLPQLENADKSSLVLTTSNAGLMIYNRDTDLIEYWDGSKWIATGDTIRVYNGINKNGSLIKLGGSLEENTIVNLNDNELQLQTRENGRFSVNDTVFVVNNRVVDIRPASFSVKSNTFGITGDEIDINGSFSVTTGSDTLTIQDNLVSLMGQLSYKDGNEQQDNVLVSDDLGNGRWAVLKPQMEIENSTMLISGTPITTNDAGGAVSNDLTLTKGRWLIFARYSARTTATTRRYLWTSITVPATGDVVYKVGSDFDSSGNSGPQIVYFVDVTQESTTYRVLGQTANTNTTITSTTGGDYFYAILLDKPLD